MKDKYWIGLQFRRSKMALDVLNAVSRGKSIPKITPKWILKELLELNAIAYDDNIYRRGEDIDKVRQSLESLCKR